MDAPLTDQFNTAVRLMLRHLHRREPPPDAIAALLWYRNLAAAGLHHHQALRALLAEALDTLAATDPEMAAMLRARYVERQKANYVAARAKMRLTAFYEWQHDATDRLCAVIQAREAQERRQRLHRLRQPIPLAATDHLIGIAPVLDGLQMLLRDDETWLVAVTGIGGIGKTTLAAAAALATAGDGGWYNLAWVAARMSFLDDGEWRAPAEDPRLSVSALLADLLAQLLPGHPAPAAPADDKALFLLRETCREQRCLLVIDNLESMAAARPLLPVLRSLVRPSKVLIGIREKLYLEPDVVDFGVPELAEADALLLLWRSAQQHLGSAATVATLHPIYAVVGGNPQALRVVAGQFVSFGLEEIIADLREVRSSRVEVLYDHIYRRAWQALSPSERHVLLALAATDAGGEPLGHLVQLADLDERAVLDAIETLVVRNLVERRRQDNRVRYAIHNLTRTFLYRQIVDWNSGGAAGVKHGF